jgi:hypothetical protein
MERMSRAGRIAQFKRILYQHAKRNDDPWMTTGMVTRRAGLKSSTHFKNMLFQMALEMANIWWTEDRGMREYAWISDTQIPLPERYIVINGHSHKVADWVLDPSEVNNHA